MAFLSGWTYRKSITVSRASGAVTNYQLKLLLGESSGAAGKAVDCGALCKTDFSDIRFTTSDGTTLLDYWIESVSGTTPNQLATVWIEFGSIGTGATTFYMYYGNSGASAVSNGNNTFQFFDDFSGTLSDKWTTTGATNSGGICTATATAVINGSIASKLNTIGVDTVVRTRFKTAHTNNASYIESFGMTSISGGTKYIRAYATYSVYQLKYVSYNGSWGTAVNITGFSPDTYAIMQCVRNGSTSIVFTVNDANTGTLTTQIPTGAAFINFDAINNGSSFAIDWIFQKTYLATEPAWGSWGTQEVALPELTTQPASDVSYTSFTANGTITDVRYDSPTIRGFAYKIGTTGNPTIADSEVHEDGTFSTGAYSLSISSLTNNADYRVASYATNSVGTSYGSTIQVTTLDAKPTLTTEAVANETLSSFTANGTIISIGNATPTIRGFVYKTGTTGDPTLSDSEIHETGSYSTGAYSLSISSLPSTGERNYRVASYSTNSYGTAYGSTVQATLEILEETYYTLDVAYDPGFTTYVDGYHDLNVGSVLTYAVPVRPAQILYYRTRRHEVVNGVLVLTTGYSNIKQVAPAVIKFLNYKIDISTNPEFTDFVATYEGHDALANYSEVVSGLSAQTIYYYRVHPYSPLGIGGDSNIIAVATGMATPVALAATNITTSSFQANRE